MLTTIGEFRDLLTRDPSRLVGELQATTGRFGAEEAEVWRRSLPKLSQVLASPALQPVHLFFGSRGNLALEYQLPAASSWCDAVLLGAHAGRSAAVIVELKDWITRADRPGRAEGLIERQGRQVLHPSDQVRGYTEYCRRFHSAVLDRDASVHGCVLFTGDRWASAYSAPPNHRLAEEYPLFSDGPRDARERLPAFLATRLSEVDHAFAHEFANGRYRQQRGFVAQIGAQILDPDSPAFELLDSQRRAFALCQAAVHQTFHAIDDRAPRKRVVIVVGPPGSGKSAIAARLWASLVTDPDLPEGDVVFTTTSMSQNSNWAELFRRVGKTRGASGVVRKATTYSPLTTQRLGQLRKRHGKKLLHGGGEWREHLQLLQQLGEQFREGARDDQNLVSIVDEAHALINPEHVTGRGQFGFATTLGPQAYHIIRTSVLSVFLLDPAQGFRQRENTSIDDIRRWAIDAGAADPEMVSLDEAQFRCAGSAEFVAWLEGVLAGNAVKTNRAAARAWRNKTSRTGMDLRLFEDPYALEDALRERIAEGNTARLLSTYSRRWVTEGAAQPHALEGSLQDFHERIESGPRGRRWSRPWNFVRNGTDYTWFVAGPAGSYIADDPLCEVGCPYVVRGFDFDYVGILWLNDLQWRDGRWVVNPSAVEESGVEALTRRARRESATGRAGSATAELLQRVSQAYRILFTRALKGVYVWIPDEETRSHLAASIDTSAGRRGRLAREGEADDGR
jgi:uncharacterized protein